MKAICFYLPQYHPTPENDEWWGHGFTDWINVANARPRFSGHYQPHLPADLGFYDLRLKETRLAQANLAESYGIHGFCYYHYWFNGSRLLGRPFDEVLQSGEPDYPFCLCWANENWTRAWDGLDHQVLIRHEYTEADNRKHIAWLINAFSDPRYIKIDGRPLFLIYRVENIPDCAGLVHQWQRALNDANYPGLYLCAMKTGFSKQDTRSLLASGFDAVVDFQPNRDDFPPSTNIRFRLYQFLQRVLPDAFYQSLKLRTRAVKRIDYETMMSRLSGFSPSPEYRELPCVFPSWDNSPRRASATIIQNLDPLLFRQWLEGVIRKVRGYPESEQLVFINAWNEWAEGCHLEPDRRFGHAFLKAVHDALNSEKS